MTTHAPQTPAYQLPDGRALSTAAHQALDAAHNALQRLGRVMTVVTAAAVRDILTDCDHDAPFDAAHAELVAGDDGSLFLTGRYWTTQGEETTFTDTLGEADACNGIFEANEWTGYLNDDTREVWRPLCTEDGVPDSDGRPVYRLDLAKAASLSLD